MKSLYRFGLFDEDEMARAIALSAINKGPVPVCMFDVITNDYEFILHKYWSVVIWDTPDTYITRYLYSEYQE